MSLSLRGLWPGLAFAFAVACGAVQAMPTDGVRRPEDDADASASRPDAGADTGVDSGPVCRPDAGYATLLRPDLLGERCDGDPGRCPSGTTCSLLQRVVGLDGGAYCIAGGPCAALYCPACMSCAQPFGPYGAVIPFGCSAMDGRAEPSVVYPEEIAGSCAADADCEGQAKCADFSVVDPVRYPAPVCASFVTSPCELASCGPGLACRHDESPGGPRKVRCVTPSTEPARP
jgi:hypothetical protein